jgi:hypothetical protein
MPAWQRLAVFEQHDGRGRGGIVGQIVIDRKGMAVTLELAQISQRDIARHIPQAVE